MFHHKTVTRWGLRLPVATAVVLFACGDDDIAPPLPDTPPSSNGGAGGGDTGMQALVQFYEENSLLAQAERYAGEVAGDSEQWNGPFTTPEPELMTEEVGEFLTIYPRSYLPATGSSVMGTLGDEALWQALDEIGITLMHPVAFEQAGQLKGRELSDSIDGGFDRVSMAIEPMMGTEDEVRALVAVAEQHGAIIAGDIIPLHTGQGYDFRLAEMNYGNYPGIYDMVEVPQEQWGMLPQVDEEWGFEILTKDQAQPFIEMGIIPGQFDVLLGLEESTDWSGWAATSTVMGVDGQERRWLYAHLFKPEQPAINWMDPTYAGRRTQSGDIARHVIDLGTTINRLDAVPFIGLEPQTDSNEIDVFTNELAILGTNDLAFTHRKLGGWTWVELNTPVAEFQRYMENGPDIGYDFFTRAQTVHGLINGDARILRVAHRTVIDSDVPHSRLIHALQNHDEIAYQMINLRAQDEVMYGDETLSGTELADRILAEAQEATAGEAAPYNALYRPAENGIATTFAGFIAPALGIDPYQASMEEVETIKRAHAMLAVVSAMQPGVFALSQWDLVGALPLDRSQVQDRIESGDLRWINRGSVDLMGVADTAESPFGLPEAEHLYAPLPEQLEDPRSFASRVRDIIAARKRYDIGHATAVAAPDVENQAVFALVMTLPDDVGGVAVTVANYGQEEASVSVDLADIMNGMSGTPREIISQMDEGTLDGTSLTVTVEGLEGKTFVIGASPVMGGS